MKSKVYQICLFAVLFYPKQGQCQQTAFSIFLNGSTDINAICENAAGNFVAAGYVFSGTQSDATIMEISPSGSILQQNVFGSSASELPYSIVQAAAGYYLVTGTIYDNFNDYDWFIAKLDSDLQLVWFKRMGAVSGNDYANSCYEVSPNHFVVTGTTGLSGSAKPSTVMIDSSGAVSYEGYLNTNQFASPNYRGRYLGNGEVAFANLATAIAVVDTTGALIKQAAFNFATYTRDIQPTSNGGYAICGVGGYGSPQGSSIAFAITDSMLTTTTLLKRFNQNGFDLSVVGMEVDWAGNYILAVNAMGLSSGNTAPLVVKIDGAGNLSSSRSYLPLGIQNTMLNSMIETTDGGYLIAGGTGTTGFIAKIDSASSCFYSPFSLSTNTLSLLGATPHSPFSGSISTINPQVNSIASGTLSPNYLCNPNSFAEPESGFHIQIYPTLTSSVLNISISDAKRENFQIEVINHIGELVMSKLIINPTTLDVSSLKQGLYICRFKEVSSGQISNIRFVKTE